MRVATNCPNAVSPGLLIAVETGRSTFLGNSAHPVIAIATSKAVANARRGRALKGPEEEVERSGDVAMVPE